jgi:hypothetical protein
MPLAELQRPIIADTEIAGVPLCTAWIADSSKGCEP